MKYIYIAKKIELYSRITAAVGQSFFFFFFFLFYIFELTGEGKRAQVSGCSHSILQLRTNEVYRSRVMDGCLCHLAAMEQVTTSAQIKHIFRVICLHKFTIRK